MINFFDIEGFNYEKTAYSDFVESLNAIGCPVHNLGESSLAGANLYGLSIGNLDNKKPIIYIEGQIHGLHEWRTAHWVRSFFDLLVNIPENKPYTKYLKKLTHEFDFYCIPLLNPYGYINNVYGNANGVDVSRNVDFNWEVTPTEIGTNQYKGPSVWSEPESRAIRDAVNLYKPFALFCCHTHGGYYGTALRPATGSNYRPILLDIVPSLDTQLNLEGDSLSEVLGVIDVPTAYNWGTTLVSDAGKQMFCCALETGSLETEFEQGRLGLNALLLLCLSTSNNFKKNKILPIKI